MKSSYFAIGYSCNHHCVFCPCVVDTPKNKNINTNDFEKNIIKLEKIKDLNNIIISGGEPSIQSNFFRIMEILNRSRFNVTILSNSDAFSNEQNVIKLLEFINPKKISITTAIHSNNNKIHDSLTLSKGSWARSIKGLNNLLKNNVAVNIKHCITKLNYKHLDVFIDFIYEEFPDNVSVSFCGVDYCGQAKDNVEKVIVSFKEFGPYLEKALDKHEEYLKKGHKRNIIINEIPMCCVDPYYWHYFNSTGKQNLSSYSSPEMIGEKNTMKKDVVSDCGNFFKKCNDCFIKDICPGAWYSAYELFGESAVDTQIPIILLGR